jgi:hypothetical protein
MPKLSLLVCAVVMAPSFTFAAWDPPDGVDLTRPRILFRRSDISILQARLEREPYRRLAQAMMQRVRQAESVALDDDSIEAHRFKSRAARNLAFFYAVDRTVRDSEVVPFASPEERQAAGDRVRELLSHLYARRRPWAAGIATSAHRKNCCSTRLPTTRCSARGTTSASTIR